MTDDEYDYDRSWIRHRNKTELGDVAFGTSYVVAVAEGLDPCVAP